MCENILFYNVVQNCSHFFQLLFFILKRGRKKNIFFSSQNILDEFFCVLFVFVFLRFFFCCFYIFFGGNKYPTNKGMCSPFSLHNLVFKKSNQAKNSLITVVTSKHLMFKKCASRTDHKFLKGMAEISVKSISRKFLWKWFQGKKWSVLLAQFFYINTYW